MLLPYNLGNNFIILVLLFNNLGIRIVYSANSTFNETLSI